MIIHAKETDDLNKVFNTETEGQLTVELPSACVYTQKVKIYRNNLTIIGNGSTIQWDDHNGMVPGFGTFASATLSVLGDNVTLRNLVIRNTFDYPGQRALRGEGGNKKSGLQAVALYTGPLCDETNLFDCKLLSWQDTLYCDGIHNSYNNCLIEGNIDFIFGRSHAVFRNCEIVSNGEGFVTAPSTMADKETGLVFIGCRLSSTENVPERSVYLARPWHPEAKPGVCSYVHFQNCSLGSHIRTELWTTMHDKNGGTHYPHESRFSIDEMTRESLEK